MNRLHGDNDDRQYLASDLTIDTTSDTYSFIYAYGLTMGVVIVIVFTGTLYIVLLGESSRQSQRLKRKQSIRCNGRALAQSMGHWPEPWPIHSLTQCFTLSTQCNPPSVFLTST